MNKQPLPGATAASAGSLSLQLASLFGLGRSPFAPATVATLFAGIPAACILALLPAPAALTAVGIVFALSCYVSEMAERELKREDPGEIVIDELSGFLVTMVGLPLSVKSILAGFIAFRLFDIYKPWPVYLIDRKMKGGIAVVADDVAAGIYAHLAVWATLQLWP